MRKFLIEQFWEDEDDYKDWIVEMHIVPTLLLVILALFFILNLYI